MAILKRISQLFSRDGATTHNDIPPPPPPLHIPRSAPASDLEHNTNEMLQESVANDSQEYRETRQPEMHEIQQAVEASRAEDYMPKPLMEHEAPKMYAEVQQPAPAHMEPMHIEPAHEEPMPEMHTPHMEEPPTQEIHVERQPSPFYLHHGGELRSIMDLAHALEHMSDEVFYHHVTDGRNDFASWVRGEFKEYGIAHDMELIHNKLRMRSLLLGEPMEEEHCEPCEEPKTESCCIAPEIDASPMEEEPMKEEVDMAKETAEVEINLEDAPAVIVEKPPLVDTTPEPVHVEPHEPVEQAYDVPEKEHVEHKDVSEAPDHEHHDERINDLKENAEELRMDMTKKQEQIKELTREIEGHRIQLARIHDEIDQIQFSKDNQPESVGKGEIVSQIQRVQELVLDRDFTQARIVYDHAKQLLKNSSDLSEEEHIELDNSLKGVYADLTLAMLQ